MASSLPWRRVSAFAGPLIWLALVFCLFWAADEWRASARGTEGRFATAASARLMVHNTALVGVAALGMTLVIIAGGIDLSVAAGIALSATVSAWCFREGYHPLFGMLAAICTGVLAGLCNGALVSALRVVPFIITLGTMTIFRGIGREIAGGTPIRAFGKLPDWLLMLERPTPNPEWLIVSPGVWVLVVFAVIVAAVLHLTVFGRHLYAVGSNEATARLCGISLTFTRMAVYSLAGFFAGVAGLYNLTSLSEGDPNSLPGRELDIIAAVVIGGGSLSGGRGSVLGTLSGALLMQVIRHGCRSLNIPTAYEQIIIGVIVIVAVTLDQVRQRRIGRT
ncbi:MAG: ABC transporter permease [Planctomycetaceae bacterium]|nr:ABC transporter permease [Planctomycetaceae bacterium]